VFLWRQFDRKDGTDRSQDIDVRTAAAASVTAFVTAPIGVKFASRVSDLTLKRVFAVGIVAMGPLLWYRSKVKEQRAAEARANESAVVPRQVSLSHAALAGCAVGFFSGLSGYGAGLLMSSFLALTSDMQQQQIVGTSLLALALPNMAQVAMHLRVGTIVKPVAAAVACGALIGAPLGSTVALHIDDAILRNIFAAFLTLQGGRALWRVRPRRT
jgi:uncharacterized membrane protein YfcA